MNRRKPATSSRGMVTFELAIGILSAALLTAMLGWGIGLISLQARCTDAASQIARQLARGDAEAAEAARERVPDEAAVQITEGSAEVEVLVSVQASWGVLGPIEVAGHAAAPTGGR